MTQDYINIILIRHIRIQPSKPSSSTPSKDKSIPNIELDEITGPDTVVMSTVTDIRVNPRDENSPGVPSKSKQQVGVTPKQVDSDKDSSKETLDETDNIEISLATMLSIPDTTPTKEMCCGEADFHEEEAEEEMFYNQGIKDDCAECTQQQAVIAESTEEATTSAQPEIVDIEDSYTPYYILAQRYRGYL